MDEERYEYERTIDELETRACKWWPRELREEATRMSVLQTLIDTQERFISILKLADKNRIEDLFALINASNITNPLFLKHLVVLIDVGGEPLQRINKNFAELFPDGVLTYDIGNGETTYQFAALPVSGTLNNHKMRIDTPENLNSEYRTTDLFKDLVMLLIFGGASVSPRTRAILFKCTTFEYLGDDTKAEEFVRQNYLRVSRIIGGKTASDLGNVAQQYAVKYIAQELGDGYNVKSNGTIPGVTQNDGATLTTFDLVIDRKGDTSRHKKYVAVEVTFQETTNSTIERKGGQARDRFEKIASSRNYIAYIIDGVGNFTRRATVSVLCENSHCNVTYTEDEFQVLIQFIKEKIG